MRHPVPQRVVLALLAAALPAAQPVPAQTTAGAQLWRLAAATLSTPGALTLGATGSFWNPAQPFDTGAVVAGLDVIQTPAVLRVTGFVAALHAFIRPVGSVGLLYSRMAMRDLVRTSASPDPVAGAIPFHTSALGLSWTRTWRGTTLGSAVRVIETEVDVDRKRRWTVDGGAQHRVGRLRVGVATHLLSTTHSTAAHDVYAGVALELWRGEAWVGSQATSIAARYGASFAHGFAPDHLVGVGIALTEVFGADLMVARDGGYAGSSWHPVGALYLTVGRYRVDLAANVGVEGVGSTFRVGLETRWH